MTRALRRADDIRGFTIIELLFVVTVMGILASIAVPRYNRYLVRADAVELGSRVTTIELGVREAEVMDGELPPGSRAGVAPAGLERFLPDSLFRAPVGVDLLYLMVDGRPYGVNGKVPGVMLIGRTSRAKDAIAAMATVYPRTASYGSGMVLFPFEGSINRPGGGAPAGSPAGGGAAASATPQAAVPQGPAPQQAPVPAAQAQPTPNQPVQSQPTPTERVPDPVVPSQPAPSQGGAPAGSSGLPSYTPPPNACLMGGLPPGQQKQCASGGGNSAWFHNHGNGNGNGNGHDHGNGNGNGHKH